MTLALTRRFPELQAVPRIALGTFPTPVQPCGGTGLVCKRDDRSGEPFGGNKLRALEFLLAAAPSGARLVTMGGVGSTHALSTVVFGHRAGHEVRVGLWRQVMNDAASVVGERIAREAEGARVFSHPAMAYLWA